MHKDDRSAIRPRVMMATLFGVEVTSILEYEFLGTVFCSNLANDIDIHAVVGAENELFPLPAISGKRFLSYFFELIQYVIS